VPRRALPSSPIAGKCTQSDVGMFRETGGQCKLSIITPENAKFRHTRGGRRCRCAAASAPGSPARTWAARRSICRLPMKKRPHGPLFLPGKRAYSLDLSSRWASLVKKSGRRGRFFFARQEVIRSLCPHGGRASRECAPICPSDHAGSRAWRDARRPCA